MQPSDPNASTASGLQRLLNTHGYGFQARALAECDLAQSISGPSGVWRLRGTEVPVAHNQRDHHIDGVLEFSSHSNLQQFAVVECKRANPSLSRWCFASAQERHYLCVETYDASNRAFAPTGQLFEVPTLRTKVAHVGVELKTGQGSENGVGRQFEEAVSQVLKGTAAFVESLTQWTGRNHVSVIPMVLTTASLWYTPTRLDAADLLSGDLGPLAVEQVPWLWYEVHVSRSLTPRVRRPEHRQATSNPIEQSLAYESRRPIAIVNAAGIKEALGMIASPSLGRV